VRSLSIWQQVAGSSQWGKGLHQLDPTGGVAAAYDWPLGWMSDLWPVHEQ
jgi:hypothetical protein